MHDSDLYVRRGSFTTSFHMEIQMIGELTQMSMGWGLNLQPAWGEPQRLTNETKKYSSG